MPLVHHLQLALCHGLRQFDIAIQHVTTVKIHQSHNTLELLGADQIKSSVTRYTAVLYAAIGPERVLINT